MFLRFFYRRTSFALPDNNYTLLGKRVNKVVDRFYIYRMRVEIGLSQNGMRGVEFGTEGVFFKNYIFFNFSMFTYNGNKRVNL